MNVINKKKEEMVVEPERERVVIEPIVKHEKGLIVEHKKKDVKPEKGPIVEHKKKNVELDVEQIAAEPQPEFLNSIEDNIFDEYIQNLKFNTPGEQ